MSYEVKQKICQEVTVKRVYGYTDYRYTYYGTPRYIYRFEDDDGNILVWKTSVCAEAGDYKDLTEVKERDKVILAGSVKSIEDYHGESQVVLTRCKVKEITFSGPSYEEIQAEKRKEEERIAKEQLDSLEDGDAAWFMPYRQYKSRYSDCETIKGSFRYEEGIATIGVIVRRDRLKKSGTRFKYYNLYRFESDDDKVFIKAVSEENALKQMKKNYDNYSQYELIGWERYADYGTR